MTTQTITVVGGNLFSLAAQLLGDARQWLNIAQINGLLDPFLTGPVVLQIPSANPAVADGVSADK